VRRLLKKLSFIFELPTRLKRTVELDAGAEAVCRPCLSNLRPRALTCRLNVLPLNRVP
jgi:hypothetical protein